MVLVIAYYNMMEKAIVVYFNLLQIAEDDNVQYIPKVNIPVF